MQIGQFTEKKYVPEAFMRHRNRECSFVVIVFKVNILSFWLKWSAKEWQLFSFCSANLFSKWSFIGQKYPKIKFKFSCFNFLLLYYYRKKQIFFSHNLKFVDSITAAVRMNYMHSTIIILHIIADVKMGKNGNFHLMDVMIKQKQQ